MTRLIDADELVRKEIAFVGGPRSGGKILAMIHSAIRHIVDNAPTVIAEPVRHGKWLIEAHKENANFRWNVTAKCSECDYDLGEIWAGFFPCIPDGIAEDVCFNSAKSVDVSNYCPHCGAKMGD